MKVCIGVVLCLAALPAAAAAAGPVRVKPAVTVHGANVELRGSGFRGTKTVVRIGGRRATVTRGTTRLLRVVVPKLRPGRHAIVAGRLRGNIRLVRPYRGRIGVRRDTRRATHATIGPAGGTLRTRAADGTVLTLTVPAGALATATALTISPARVRGLPFTGEFSVAAHFAPEGLRFARPARLTMRLKRKPKRRLVGFDAAGNGTGLGFARARVSGRTITKDVEHFSVDGAGSAAPQDILIFLQGIVESEFPLPVGQIELLREQIGVWVELFGADVCVELCSAVQEIVIASLVFHVDDACEDARAAPSLAGYERIAALDGMRSDFGGNEVIGDECRSEVLTTIVDRAINAAAADPLATAETGELPAGGAGLQLDGRERVTWFEWLVHLSTQAQVLGENVLRTRLDAAADAARPRMIVLNRPGCDTEDRERATEHLATAWDYALRLADFVEETRSALDYCRVEVDMAPVAAFAPTSSASSSRASAASSTRPQQRRQLVGERRDDHRRRPLHGPGRTGELHRHAHERPQPQSQLDRADHRRVLAAGPLCGVRPGRAELLDRHRDLRPAIHRAGRVRGGLRGRLHLAAGRRRLQRGRALRQRDQRRPHGRGRLGVRRVEPELDRRRDRRRVDGDRPAARRRDDQRGRRNVLQRRGRQCPEGQVRRGDRRRRVRDLRRFRDPGDQNPVVYLVCSGIEVFRAEGQSTASFGKSGALEPGSCQLNAEAHSDRDTSGTSTSRST